MNHLYNFAPIILAPAIEYTPTRHLKVSRYYRAKRRTRRGLKRISNNLSLLDHNWADSVSQKDFTHLTCVLTCVYNGEGNYQACPKEVLWNLSKWFLIGIVESFPTFLLCFLGETESFRSESTPTSSIIYILAPVSISAYKRRCHIEAFW